MSPPPAAPLMDPMRKASLAGGLAYLATFVVSIPQLGLYTGVIDDPTGFIRGAGSNTACCGARFSRSSPALTGIGTAVALYPITKRDSRPLRSAS